MTIKLQKGHPIL